MLLLGVVVAVLAAVPLGLIKNFGEDQRRLERTESLSFVKDLEIRYRSTAVEIGQHVPRARFGDNARTQRIAGAVGAEYFDLGKLFAEFVQQRLAAVAPDVKIQLSFFLRGRNRILPGDLPRGLSIRGKQCGTGRDREKKKQ